MKPTKPVTKKPVTKKPVTKKPVTKQLYRLNIEPAVVDRLARLAARAGEPKTRLAARLFTEAVMAYQPPAKVRPGVKI